MKIIDINPRDISLDEDILIYDISCKTNCIGSIPLHVRFDKKDGFIKIYDGIRHLVLFHYLNDKICNRSKFFRSKKVVLQRVLIIILQKSALIHINLDLLIKYWFFIIS